MEEQKTNIIGKAEVSKEKMMAWAKSKNNNEEYLLVMDLAWEMAEHLGIRPDVACCQISKETGYLYKNGSAAGLDASFHNPCGLKITQGGGDYVASAHMKFSSWEHGILAYLDHLSLYAGLEGYPLGKDYTLDPRHFPYLKGTAKYVEDLGGKWCPNVEYGKDIVRMVNEIKGNETKEDKKENEIKEDKKENEIKEDKKENEIKEDKKENEIKGGEKMLPINRSYLNGSARWGTVNVPKYIVIHYTGNKNADTALNNVVYMNRVGENAGGSAHYYVDNTSIYQLLEDNWDSWSVGDDNGYGRFAFGINNNNQISIEMCCTSGNYRVSDKTQENCAELVAHLLKKHGLGLDKVKRHYDASRKSCPAQFCPYNTYYPYNDGENNWAKFKQKVAKYYNGGTQSSTTNDVIYRVKLANGTQIGAYRSLDSAKALAQVNKCNVYRSTDNVLIASYVTNPNVANKTINYRVKDVNGVQLGAFNSLGNAKALAEKQKAIVYDANNKVVASYVSTTDEISRYVEEGTFYPNTTIYFRNAPDLNSPTQGTYESGESVNYDLVVLGKSYNWISWISASTGIRRYMPIRDKATGEKWGYAV